MFMKFKFDIRHSFKTGRYLGSEGHDVHETGIMSLSAA